MAHSVALVRSVVMACYKEDCAFGLVFLGGTEACGVMGEEEAADDLTGASYQVADLKYYILNILPTAAKFLKNWREDKFKNKIWAYYGKPFCCTNEKSTLPLLTR